MNIRVHYPTTEEGKRALQERIDTFHANFIIKKVNELDCSYENKLELLEEIRQELRKKERGCAS